VVLAPLAFVMVMSFGLNRMSSTALKALFWAFSAVMGLSLSSIFFVYTGPRSPRRSLPRRAPLPVSACSATPPQEPVGHGQFLIMGLFGLIIASLINLFLASPGLAWGISFLGVLIFAGLTAYDTQRLKEQYAYVAGTDYGEKVVVMGALTLYLDFINMFTMLLQLMGDRR
jgi:FtsH-binding integral membrane protein